MSAPDKIMAWPSFGPESVTGTWSANTYHGSAEPFLKETPARLHADELAEALREALQKIEDIKKITGLGFPSFHARTAELIAKLDP